MIACWSKDPFSQLFIRISPSLTMSSSPCMGTKCSFTSDIAMAMLFQGVLSRGFDGSFKIYLPAVK